MKEDMKINQIRNIMPIIWNTVSVVTIWVLSTMLAVLLNSMNVRIENLLLIYVVGVVLCSVETRSLLWGIGSSMIFLFTFNFLFTVPKFTFHMNDVNDVISLAIFIIVAFIVASLTVKLQKQMDIANRRVDVAGKLNQIGSGFLNIAGIPALVDYSRESLEKLMGKRVGVLIRGKENQEFADNKAEWCFQNVKECGHGKSRFGEADSLYIPIHNSSRIYGVLVLGGMTGELEKEERVCLDTVIAQITLVLQREEMGEEKEAVRVQIEKERLKSMLLRSISHDLRTPLTGIAGSANFLRDNYELIDQETMTSMLADICNDAEWLNSMVENLLNMTRIQEGRLDLHQKMEVVDDLISAAVTLVSKRLGNHRLETSMPAEIVLVPVDGRLFIQVLVNLMDNAIRHSGEKTEIRVSARLEGEKVCFLVEDDGIGIAKEHQEKLFDSFFTTAYKNGDKQRGVGLGLGICKAIVEAHGGSIVVYNNEHGGATFRIDLNRGETT